MRWYTRPWLFCVPLRSTGPGGFLVTRYVCVSKWEVLCVVFVFVVLCIRFLRSR